MSSSPCHRQVCAMSSTVSGLEKERESATLIHAGGKGKRVVAGRGAHPSSFLPESVLSFPFLLYLLSLGALRPQGTDGDRDRRGSGVPRALLRPRGQRLVVSLSSMLSGSLSLMNWIETWAERRSDAIMLSSICSS